MEPLDLLRDLGILGLLAGALGLDRRGAFQLMASQPLVAAWLVGLWFEVPGLGLALGALLQLLWLPSSLFGANVPPNETVASLSIAGMACLAYRYGAVGGSLEGLVAAAVLLGAPLCRVGRACEILNDRANARLAEQADQAARAGDVAALGRLPWVGLRRMFLWNAGLVVLASAVGALVLVLIQPLLQPLGVQVGLAVVGAYVLPAVGVGVALAHLRKRRGLALALAAFVLLWVRMPGAGA